jgi:hypothetical protein
MARRSSEETIETWRRLVEEWVASGATVSAAEWCREREIRYNAFLYWKKRLSAAEPDRVDRSCFKELSPFPVAPGIALEYQEMRIELMPNFDGALLVRCLRAMKEASC